MQVHMKHWALFISIAYFFLATWIYLQQRSLLYSPSLDHGDIKNYNLGRTQEFFLETIDHLKLQTWIHPPALNKPYVIWLSGNAHNLSYRQEKFRELIHMGYGFIAPSWRGFGKSEGSPSLDGLYNDARAAIHYLQQLGVDTKNTLLIGESLGSGIAVQMTLEYPFKGLLLISPYTSIADRGQEIYWYLPVKLLLKDNFENLEKIDKINTPLLIVHGDHDEVTPHTHSLKLIAKAKEPKKLILYPNKGHSNLEDKDVFKQMSEFFKVKPL